MISQANHIKFLIWDNEEDKAVTNEDPDIEFTYNKHKDKLIVWRTRQKEISHAGLCLEGVEVKDFIDDFEIISLTEL